MSRVTGVIYIDFETGGDITNEQFKKFKAKMSRMVEDWEMMVYDAATSCEFEADELHPLILDDLEMDEE